MQQLHNLIDDLERQRQLINRRLSLAGELLNTYDPTDANDNDLAPGSEVVTITTIPMAPQQPPKAKPKKPSERVACPDCGEMFAVQGLGPHRARKHPSSAAKPLTVVPGRPTGDRDPMDTFGNEFYACSSCSHEEPNLAGMRRHTLAVHGRSANDAERQAIAS